MKKSSLPRIVYCGNEDSFFRKLSKYADDLLLEARNTSFGGSPQKFAQSKKACVLILKIKNEFDLKHQEWLSKNDAMYPVIVISVNGTVETAIHALQYGIFDYFCASQGLERIVQRIRDAVVWRNLRSLKRPVETVTEPLLLGKHPEILSINDRARTLAHENKPLLVLGEQGTGKEHLAYGIYTLSSGKLTPFLRYGCRLLQQLSAYDGRSVPELIQLHMQSMKKNSGAGVMFLSHLEQVRRDQQQEILERWTRSPIRLIASYQENLSPFLDEKTETTLSSLKIPPLRNHKDDIPLMTQHFIRKISQQRAIRMKSIAPEISIIMQDYSWPGNVQELSNLVERMMILEPSSVLTASTWHLCHGHPMRFNLEGANKLSSLMEAVLQNEKWREGGLYNGFMEMMEEILIDLVLPKVDHNQAIAAKILGISRNTLRQKIKSKQA